MHPLLSRVALSNLFTKGVAAKKDPRQTVLPSYGIPDQPTRKLLAQLVLEEALETVRALGFDVSTPQVPDVVWHTGCSDPNIETIIDGACDTIYVATGVLVACGVPDRPHLDEVCRANDAKFPDGEAVVQEGTGKYLKPVGWFPPQHERVRDEVRVGGTNGVNLQEIQHRMLTKGKD